MSGDIVVKRGTRLWNWRRWGEYLLGVALAVGALALGSVHTPVLCGVLGLLIVSNWLLWVTTRSMSLRPEALVLVGTGVGLTLFTALQLVPLPMGLLSRIAPHSFEVWSRAALETQRLSSTFAPISLDPTATTIEVVRGVTYLLAFVAALRVGHRSEGGVSLGLMVTAGVTLTALASVLHPLVGASSVFGVYTPENQFDSRHIAPILNSNCLSAYLNVAFAMALSYALSGTRTQRLPLAWFAVAGLVGVQIWIASRGGLLAMGVGALLLLGFRWAARKGSPSAHSVAVIPTLVILLGIAMVVAGVSREAFEEIGSSDTSKLDLIRNAFSIVPKAWAVGVGRGSFESVFPAFRQGVGHVVYTHPENVIAQWACEWGVPVTLIATASFGYAFWLSPRILRDPVSMGAWVAIVECAVHNLVDLNSEVPGVVLTLAACAAMVVGGSSNGAEGRVRGVHLRLRGFVTTVAATGVAFAIASLRNSPNELVAERLRLKALVSNNTGVLLDDLIESVKGAMSRHPAEPFFPYVVALEGGRVADRRALSWGGMVLERAPVYAPAHVALARTLAQWSPSQARLEYRMAFEQEPGLQGPLAPEAARLVHRFDDALQLVPEPEKMPGTFRALGDAVQPRLPATAQRINEALLAVPSHQTMSLARKAAERVYDLESGPLAPWCWGDVPRTAACRKEASALVETLLQREPRSCEYLMLKARILAGEGRAADAMERLQRMVPSATDRATCLRGLLGLAERAGDRGRAESAIEQLVRGSASVVSESVDNLLAAAWYRVHQGEGAAAVQLASKAQRMVPENDAVLLALAQVASQGGLHGAAFEAYERLVRRHPENNEWIVARDTEKRAHLSALAGDP